MIHRYHTGPPMDVAYFISGAVRDLHDEVVDWTDETLPDGVRSELDELGGMVPEQDLPRHRANIVRWWLLDEYGGTWLDHDVLPLRRLDRGPDVTGAIGSMRCSCVVRLTAHHDLARRMLDEIRQAPEGDSAPAVSGDHLLTRLCPTDMGKLHMPHTAVGRLRLTPTWGIHLWATSSRRWNNRGGDQIG